MNLLKFSGRVGEREYWRFARVPFLFLPVAGVVAYGVVTVGVLRWSSLALLILLHVGVLVHLAMAPFWLVVTVRRLHDTGRSARWLLPYAVVAAVWALIIYWTLSSLFGRDVPEEQSEFGFVLVAVILSGIWALITLACAIVLLVLCSQAGTTGPNRYGPNPLPAGPGMERRAVPDIGSSPSPPESPSQTPPGCRSRCPGCDGELAPEARFCRRCGTPAHPLQS